MRAHHRDCAEDIIAVGLAFGEAVLAETDYDEWVWVNGPFAEEMVLRPKNARLVCDPIGLIKKKLERNAPLDITGLCNGLIRGLQEWIECAQKYDIQ